MNREEKKVFRSIIRDFQKSGEQVKVEDGLKDTSIVRTAFYGSCLKVVRDGPPMKSPAVQKALIEYYTRLHRIEYHKVFGTFPTS